jgi:hypothetical protein
MERLPLTTRSDERIVEKKLREKVARSAEAIAKLE